MQSRFTREDAAPPILREKSTAADAILDLALGHHTAQAPSAKQRLSRRLSRRFNACRLFHRGPLNPEHGQRRKANVVRVGRNLSLFVADRFHFVLEMPWQRLLCIFCSTYLLSFTFFATIYRTVCSRCDLGCQSFMDALFLSVETMMTIGYGVPDPYFKSCPWLVAVITAQCMLGVLWDASLLGIIYQRISAGSKRAATIVFSEKAVFRTIGGENYFMFQVCEMRALQLVECHVHCYLFTRPCANNAEEAEVEGQVDVAMLPMRLDQPDDSLGATLLLVLPTTVVHRVDGWSPLRGSAPPRRESAMGSDAPAPTRRSFPSPVLLQRGCEANAGMRYNVWCEVCGECFYHHEQLHLHVAYCATLGAGDPPHAALLERLPAPISTQEARRRIQSFLSTRFAEVVCIVEGIDPVTSSNVQARHSYVAGDIVWDHTFANCLFEAELPSGEVGLQIDFSYFHKLEPCRRSDHATGAA